MSWKHLVKLNDAVERHRDSWKDFNPKHDDVCRLAAQFGRRGVAHVATRLFTRATDDRSLFRAWNFVAEHSGDTPGPDEFTPDQASGTSEVWDGVRGLRQYLRSGSYQHGETRSIWVRKKSGNGRRRIDIPNFDDRVAQRSVVQVLQPLIDGNFDEASFGFRPGLGRQHALAAAEMRMEEGRLFVLAEDIRDAFGCVPQQRLLQILPHYAPADDFVDLVRRMIMTTGRIGLRPGSPLSPLLLNVHLHHLFDRVMTREYRDFAWLRYADDLAFLCWAHGEALAAREVIAGRLRVAGFTLKQPVGTVVHDLGAGQRVTWLGYDIGWRNGRLDVRVPEAAWAHLRRKLVATARTGDRADAVQRVIRGWTGQLGPAFDIQSRQRNVNRIGAMVAEIGLDASSLGCSLAERLTTVYQKWCRLRSRLRADEWPLPYAS